MAATLRDPLSVLGQRSPGMRPDGALFQTKLQRETAFGTLPVGERVLSGVRRRPEAPSFAAPPVLVPVGPTGDLLPETEVAAPASDLPTQQFFTGPLLGGGFVGGVIGSGGGGSSGGGGGGGTTPTETVTPSVPAAGVPEPSTWLTMILGFGIAGAALRRRVARRVASLRG